MRKVAGDIPLDEIKTKLCNLVDLKVDEYRSRYPAPGRYISDEYSLAYRQAYEYLHEYEGGPVPPCVTSWAAASGMSGAEAAQDIVETGNLYNEILERTRDIRLRAKAAIQAATTAFDARLHFDTFQRVMV